VTSPEKFLRLSSRLRASTFRALQSIRTWQFLPRAWTLLISRSRTAPKGKRCQERCMRRSRSSCRPSAPQHPRTLLLPKTTSADLLAAARGGCGGCSRAGSARPPSCSWPGQARPGQSGLLARRGQSGQALAAQDEWAAGGRAKRPRERRAVWRRRGR
jgi:hypothetical protein